MLISGVNQIDSVIYMCEYIYIYTHDIQTCFLYFNIKGYYKLLDIVPLLYTNLVYLFYM